MKVSKAAEEEAEEDPVPIEWQTMGDSAAPTCRGKEADPPSSPSRTPLDDRAGQEAAQAEQQQQDEEERVPKAGTTALSGQPSSSAEG